VLVENRKTCLPDAYDTIIIGAWTYC
jgi:hypothetical protein